MQWSSGGGWGSWKFFFFIFLLYNAVFKKHLKNSFINRLWISKSCVPENSSPSLLGTRDSSVDGSVSHGRGCQGCFLDDPSALLLLCTLFLSSPHQLRLRSPGVRSQLAEGFDHFHVFIGHYMAPGGTSVQSRSSCYTWGVYLFIVELKECSTYFVLSTCLHVNRKWMNK